MEQRPRKELPSRVRRGGIRLLHAQCWVWGQDIKRAEGNLLLQHGFERLRPPSGISGCSQYSLQIPGGLTVRLWGFGVFIGREKGLYLNRFDFIPRRACLLDAWTPEAFAGGPRQVDAPLLAALSTCISGYEAWVEQLLGRSYRLSTLRAGGEIADGITDLPTEWLLLGQKLSPTSHAWLGLEPSADTNAREG